MKHTRTLLMLAVVLVLTAITAHAQAPFLGVSLLQADPEFAYVNFLGNTPTWGYGAVCPLQGGPIGSIFVFSNARYWTSVCESGSYYIETVSQVLPTEIDMQGSLFNPTTGGRQAHYLAFADCEPPWTNVEDDSGGPCGPA